MEFQGVVYKIMPETRGTSARGDWQRQEVVFEMMDGQYARKVAVTFFNKAAEVQGLREGTAYNVSFNIESREYQGRWYTDVRAWRVMDAASAAPAGAPVAAQPFAGAQPSQPQQSAPVAQPQAVPATEDDVDDLPF